MTLKLLTGYVNNIDYIVTMAPVKGWDILGSKWTVSSWISCVGSRKNRQEKRSEWPDKIVMARGLGQGISKMASIVGCSWYAVVSTYQMWYKERQLVNRSQGDERPRLIDAHGKRRLACLVWRHRRAIGWRARLSALMSHVFLLDQMDVQVCVGHLPGEETAADDRPPEAVLWSAGKPWVLAFMWMLLWHAPPS